MQHVQFMQNALFHCYFLFKKKNVKIKYPVYIRNALFKIKCSTKINKNESLFYRFRLLLIFFCVPFDSKTSYLIETFASPVSIFWPSDVNRKLFCHVASPDAFVFKSACNFSQTFFFGFNCWSGSPWKPSTVIRSPGATFSGIFNGSTAFSL